MSNVCTLNDVIEGHPTGRSNFLHACLKSINPGLLGVEPNLGRGEGGVFYPSAVIPLSLKLCDPNFVQG